MTRLDSNYRARRKELARELAEVPAPPPPADLLAEIQREIPPDVASVGSEIDASPPKLWWRSQSLRRAAAIAFLGLGVVVVARLLEQREAAPVGSGGIAATGPVHRWEASGREAEKSPQALPQEKEVVAEHLERLSPLEHADGGGERRAAPAPRVRLMTDEPARVGSTHRGARALAEPEPDGRSIRISEHAAELPASTAPPSSIADSNEESITVTSEAPMVDKFNVAAARTEGAVGIVNSNSTDLLRLSAAPRRDMTVPNRPSAAPSTGGTAEPNDAPVGDMFFRQTGVNPFIDTREDKLSTFALDVDTGSWSLARSYLERGALPPPEAIRVEEFVNAQEYDDPAPRRGDFTLIAEGAPSPFAASGDYRVLRFAVKGREIDASDRKPAVLTFVVDVSGSMAREDRLGLVKRALGLLLDELREEDRVGLVVYGSRGQVLLEHTSDHERIRRAIDRLRPEGSTNAEEGLRLGYDLADQAYQRGWNNRVVLCSDGVANVGATGPESILARIGSEARRGIELTTVGFGMGNYNDALMEQLADKGDGRYHYVDTIEEAERIFLANLAGTLETIAKDAKVQVEFDPSAVERWRLLGYENRDVADRDFRNDRVDAGEIGAGHTATAVYEIRVAPGARRSDTVGILRLRWMSIGSGRVEETSLTLRVRDLDPSFEQASTDLRRAAVSAELAEILKHSFYAKEASWPVLQREAERLASDDDSTRGADERRTDSLPAMIERAAEVSAERGDAERSDEADR
jgi:Ca-activated chloride channel family protein